MQVTLNWSFVLSAVRSRRTSLNGHTRLLTSRQHFIDLTCDGTSKAKTVMDIDVAVVKYDTDVQTFVASAAKHERVLVPFGHDQPQDTESQRRQWIAAMLADTSNMIAVACLCQRQKKVYVLESLTVRGNDKQREVAMEQIFQELRVDMSDGDVILCCGLYLFPGCRLLHTLHEKRGAYKVMYLCREDQPRLHDIKKWRLLDTRNPSAKPDVYECSLPRCNRFGVAKSEDGSTYCSVSCQEKDQQSCHPTKR